MRLAVFVPVVLALCGAKAVAEAAEALPRDFGCLELGELRRDMHPSELARSVRACIEEARFADAVQVYYAYSTYGLYDQQRVRDETAHVVLGELSHWMFAFLDRDQLGGMRAAIDQMRDTGSALFIETCKGIARLGPPEYHPGYMIRYGMIPRKSENDWQVDDFDSAAAWKMALVEINKCPST